MGSEMSRRDLLVRAVQLSAGAGAAVFAGKSAANLSPAGVGGLPLLSSRPSSTSDAGAQLFRSRPDLKPPVITVNTSASGARPGLVFTEAHAGPAHQGPMIIDGNGDLVWFLDLSPGSDTGLRAFNFQVQSFKSEPLLTWFQGAVVNGHGQGHYELWDSAYKRVAQIYAHNGYQGDLHDFVITKQGTALFTCFGQATADLTKFGGKAGGSYYYGVVQEVDVASQKLLWQWRSDAHVPLGNSYLRARPTGTPWDYFHVNSVCVDPTDGNLIISGRNTWAFYKVQRPTGRVLWSLGGKTSDFKLGPGAAFAFQHDVRRHPDGSVTVFDNEGGPPAESSQSRGLVLAVDEKSRTARLVRQYLHSPPVLSEALGNVQDLTAGHVFMGWGTSSYFTEYGPDGNVLFDARLTPTTESYRAFRLPWTGTPAGQVPALAVVPAKSAATVYASYNGCTEVGQWLVLGGPSPTKLTPLGRAARHGFETAIDVPKPPLYLAVEAVSPLGPALARSAAHSAH